MSDRVSSYSTPLQMDSLIGTMTSQLNSLVAEISSGVKANPAASMGTSAALLYQLNTQANQQTTLQTTVGAASSNLDAVQAAMTSIASVAQSVATSASGSESSGVMTDANASSISSEATSALQEVLNQLNTTNGGSALFGGYSSNPPMQSIDASGGPMDTLTSMLQSAVTANGGTPLSSSQVDSLVNGTGAINGLFSNTNASASENYNGVFYTGTTGNAPTQVLIGTSQTLSYSTQANQAPFTDLLKGLSMLSLAGATDSSGNSLLDSSGQTEMINQGLQILSQAQTEVTELQGTLGSAQSQMQNVVSLQQSAATATQVQITNYTQADEASDATEFDTLQTQLQASYELTAQISQLSLTHYMPAAA